jgi:hypothetical protein
LYSQGIQAFLFQPVFGPEATLAYILFDSRPNKYPGEKALLASALNGFFQEDQDD